MNGQRLSLDDFLPYKLVQTAELVADSLASRYEAEFGISRPEWRVIASLGARDGVISKDLAKETRLDKVKVSRILSKLEEKGLVARAVDENDQRAAVIKLSAEGLELYQRVVPKVLAWERDILAGLSESEYQVLYHALDALQTRSRELG